MGNRHRNHHGRWRLLLGTAILGGALIPAGPAVAAKHKKHKTKSTVIRAHCATTIVRCVGIPGPQGPRGPVGPMGPSGSLVVARPQSVRAVTQGSMPNDTDPLTANGWTQGATEYDLIGGGASATAPAGCSKGSATVNVAVDGGSATSGTGNWTSAGQTFPIYIPAGDLPEPGVSTPHVATATVSSSCNGAGSGPVTVSAISLTVVGFK